jgi:guanine nucleotide-binding protein subunit alpha
MQDAMTIWDSICHSQWFKTTSLVSISSCFHRAMILNCSQIIFLNKDDIFKEKIKTSPIRNAFPVCFHICFMNADQTLNDGAI